MGPHQQGRSLTSSGRVQCHPSLPQTDVRCTRPAPGSAQVLPAYPKRSCLRMLILLHGVKSHIDCIYAVLQQAAKHPLLCKQLLPVIICQPWNWTQQHKIPCIKPHLPRFVQLQPLPPEPLASTHKSCMHSVDSANFWHCLNRAACIVLDLSMQQHT